MYIYSLFPALPLVRCWSCRHPKRKPAARDDLLHVLLFLLISTAP